MTSSLKRFASQLWRSKSGTVGFAIVLTAILVALLANVLAPHDPSRQYYDNVMIPPFWMDGGALNFPLGTDNLGRDVLSRIIFGTRVSLIVGVLSVLIAGAVGLVIGLVSGFFGGLFDIISMRTADAFLAIPSILFAVVLISVVGPGLGTLVIALGLMNWVLYARLVRGEVLSIRERDYVKAARLIGVSPTKIIIRHLLPNILSSFIVVSALAVASTIIAEAALSFLGLGIQPPEVSWGGMLSDGRNYLATSWWIATFPGLAITVTVLGVVFLGDWLRDILDPRSRGR